MKYLFNIGTYGQNRRKKQLLPWFETWHAYRRTVRTFKCHYNFKIHFFFFFWYLQIFRKGFLISLSTPEILKHKSVRGGLGLYWRGEGSDRGSASSSEHHEILLLLHFYTIFFKLYQCKMCQYMLFFYTNILTETYFIIKITRNLCSWVAWNKKQQWRLQIQNIYLNIFTVKATSSKFGKKHPRTNIGSLSRSYICNMYIDTRNNPENHR